MWRAKMLRIQNKGQKKYKKYRKISKIFEEQKTMFNSYIESKKKNDIEK